MKVRGKKFIALFLILSFLAINCATLRRLEDKREKREKKGAELIVWKKDGLQIRGELIAVKEDILLLLDSETGADVSNNVNDIKVIKILERSKIWEGAKIGGAIGVLGGVIIYLTSQEWLRYIYIYGAIGFGLIGVVLGGGIGAFLSVEKIKIEGMSPEGIEKVLQKLRKKARIQDYK